MKEAYAVRRIVPPSAELQAKIDGLLGTGRVEDPSSVSSQASSTLASRTQTFIPGVGDA
jgi:hypothetical protein